MGGKIWVILVVAAVALLIIWLVSTYNKLVKRKLKVEEAFSTIDVFLKKRYDLIPNLVETVKGYAAHESETLEKVVSARAKALDSSTIEQKLESEQGLSAALGRLLMVAENYPQLKADVHFTRMMDQLSSLEGEIATSRRYYNAVVKDFNTVIASFPSMIVARMGGFVPEPFFNAPEGERENVKVDFSKK